MNGLINYPHIHAQHLIRISSQTEKGEFQVYFNSDFVDKSVDQFFFEAKGSIECSYLRNAHTFGVFRIQLIFYFRLMT